MASTKYCSLCGHGNPIVNGVIPVTCSGCKKPIAGAFASVVKSQPKPIVAKKTTYVENDEDEGEVEFDGNIIVPAKFEFEVQIPKKITIADVSQGAVLPAPQEAPPQIPE